jgi:quinoprotein glucose dehydrogenase
VFEAAQDPRLVAVDAAKGSPCADFGKAGQIRLRDFAGYQAGWYHMSSPPLVIDDLVIVGSAIDDSHRIDMPRGVVRAYNARTGALRWSWDPIASNQALAATSSAAKICSSGAANAWSIMVVDPERDLIFVPPARGAPTARPRNLPQDHQRVAQ